MEPEAERYRHGPCQVLYLQVVSSKLQSVWSVCPVGLQKESPPRRLMSDGEATVTATAHCFSERSLARGSEQPEYYADNPLSQPDVHESHRQEVKEPHPQTA